MDRSFEPPIASTFVELLQANALAFGDRRAFCFIRGHGSDEAILTYRALHERATAIAAELQTSARAGERALLLFPPGPDFITAFFGCLYAGVVAVPVAIPPRKSAASPIDAIVDLCDPALVLSTADYCSRAESSYKHLPKLLERRWIAADEIETARQSTWRAVPIDPQQTAFLQYTSGSTSVPKGVMLTHENLLRNAEYVKYAFGADSETAGVIWLPQYHDMGLIGGMLQPIYQRSVCTLLAPAAFLQRPALWLETITQTRAVASGGPDFAYDLCVRKIAPEDREKLDLSTWRVAFTGAERVRASTIDRFAEAFSSCGFRREAFLPCYGLAEATLIVTGGPWQTGPTTFRVNTSDLAHDRVEEASPDDASATTLIGCGECLPGQRILIVDPRTRQQCGPLEVGEIWISSPSVARGYYNQTDATEATFGGHLASGEGPFLRSGDLGFFRNDQLFVTGRLKDVIIIRGRNHYPEDIEHSVRFAVPAFRTGSNAAFSIDIDGHERLVVVQEFDPRAPKPEIDIALKAIRRAVAAEHEVEVYAAILVRPRQVPKTSSGKTQRGVCRERYLGGGLKIVAELIASDPNPIDPAPQTQASKSPRTVSADEVERWLTERIAARLAVPTSQIHATSSFLDFGMGSVDAVEVTSDLERWLGRQVSPTAVYNYPNIAALSQWLAQSPQNGKRLAGLQQPRASCDDSDEERLLDDVRNMSEERMKQLIDQEMTKL